MVRSGGSRAIGSRLRNVVGRLAGEVEGPALLLLTHYDSVPTGPGAGDDASGVAAVLEAVRAVRQGSPLRNDLIVLVTDGEESGLLGASLFVEEHPWAGDVGLVLNFEARGNRGPVTLFETSDGNGALVRGVARATPQPMGSSMSYEVYRRMPNDTDLTVFLEAGISGLNFAMIGNHPAYHTELDTPEALDAGSLQHHADYALALTRHFGNVDLGDLEAGNAVYFNPFGSWMLVYSAGVGKGLAFALLVAVFAVLGWGASTRRLSARGVRGGLWAWLLVVVVSPVAASAMWSLFSQLFPDALASPYGEPWSVVPVRLALVLVCLAVVALVGEIVERPAPTELLAGVLVPWVVLAWAVSMFVPGAGYLLVWPALFGLGGLLLSMLVDRPAVVEVATVVGAAVAALLYAPTIVLVSQALGVVTSAVLAAAIAFPLTLALPAVRTAGAGRLSVPVLLAVLGVGLLGWVGWTAAPGDTSPAPTSLVYLLDAEDSEAWWLSYEARPDAWTGQVFGAETVPTAPPAAYPGRPGDELLRAPAPPAGLDRPTAELVSDEFDERTRLLSLRVRSPRGAPFMLLAPDPSMATIRAVGVEGRMVEVDESEGPVQLTLQGLPEDGALVSFELLDRQPMALDLLDWSWGLPALEGVELSPRPPSLLRRPRWLTDAVLVRATRWF